MKSWIRKLAAKWKGSPLAKYFSSAPHAAALVCVSPPDEKPPRVEPVWAAVWSRTLGEFVVLRGRQLSDEDVGLLTRARIDAAGLSRGDVLLGWANETAGGA